jgi:hypothetical protein
MAAIAGLAMLANADTARAQTKLVLDKPDAVLREPFTLVRGLRELADGRLIVTDWTEERVSLVDLAKGTVVNRGRVGAGPTEFRMPTTLFPFRGDSTLLVDQGNTRLAVLDKEGNIARTFQPTPPSANSPFGVDGNGRLYFAIPAWMAERPLAGDSIELARVDPATSRIEVLARVHGYTPAPQPGPTDGPRIPLVVFARQDSWTVAPNGRLAIVHGENYAVEWRDGTRAVTGPANGASIKPIPARAEERTAYARAFSESSPMSGRGPGGTLGHVPAEELTPAAIAALVRRSTWAETLPFFRPGDLFTDAAGRLWVGRWLRHDEPRQYDIFDDAGRLTASLTLPSGRRLAGIGRRHVYLLHTDADGLQTLERYRFPPVTD